MNYFLNQFFLLLGFKWLCNCKKIIDFFIFLGLVYYWEYYIFVFDSDVVCWVGDIGY